MKKLLILLIFIYGELYALERESTLKIYHNIFSAISSKTPVYIYTNDKEYRDVFKYSKRIILTNRIEKSDMVLITEDRTLKYVLEKIEENKGKIKIPLLFVTKYQLLELSEDIVGAFYWRKGRSQLLFIKKRLDKHNIRLPQKYQNFMIDEL